jgi:hypothetical protein
LGSLNVGVVFGEEATELGIRFDKLGYSFRWIEAGYLDEVFL